MKLHGKEIDARAKAEIVLPRMGEQPNLTFVIEALPLGLEEKAEKYFPNPTPPSGYARKPGGGVLRDHLKKPIVETLLNDPGYKKASTVANRRQMVFFMHYALHRGGEITFDAQPPEGDNKGDWEQFVDTLYGEFKSAGFSMGDFVILVDEIMKVSNMSGEAIEEAKEAFLSQELEG